MKQKYLYKSLTVLLLLIISPYILGQENFSEQLSIDNVAISKASDNTNITMDITIDNLKIDKNLMLLVTPMIVSESGDQITELNQFAVLGRLRNKVLNRPFTWDGKTELNFPEENRIVRKNGIAQSLHYSTSIPFENWQRDGRLILKTEIIGCADCLDAEPDLLVSGRILPERFIPEYRFSPLKLELVEHSETFKAYFNFRVGSWLLLADYKNNVTEFAKIDDVIQKFMADESIIVKSITLTGYASPEDTEKRNMELSRNRAQSVAKYLSEIYKYTEDQYITIGGGEDWSGLREAVAASNLANKTTIINIIDTEPDFDTREVKIKALDDSKTYNKLLNEYYPPLRRTDYYLSYDYPDYDEAEVSRTDFINSAVEDLSNNNAEEALKKLEKYKDLPEVWNILGVAYAQKGDMTLAAGYFNRAIENNDTDARHNLDQLQKYIEDNQ